MKNMKLRDCPRCGSLLTRNDSGLLWWCLGFNCTYKIKFILATGHKDPLKLSFDTRRYGVHTKLE